MYSGGCGKGPRAYWAACVEDGVIVVCFAGSAYLIFHGYSCHRLEGPNGTPRYFMHAVRTVKDST